MKNKMTKRKKRILINLFFLLIILLVFLYVNNQGIFDDVRDTIAGQFETGMRLFAGYSGGGGNQSTLDIWDETDSAMPYGSQWRYPGNQILFFANYTNTTSGEILNDTNANCTIKFNVSDGWSLPANMMFNETKQLWEYNYSFAEAGTYNWNATCDGSNFGYEILEANDTVIVYQFSNLSVKNVSVTRFVLDGNNLDISANVTSNNGVDTVRAEIYYPDGSLWKNATLTNTTADIYYNDAIDVSFYPHGSYNITIWANDSAGVINNSEKTWFASYKKLSDLESIIIDGLFSDWASVEKVTDLLGDVHSIGLIKTINFDFSGITYPSSTHKATFFMNDSIPPINLSYIDEKEFNSSYSGNGGDYPNISASDNSYAKYGIQTPNRSFQKFSFDLGGISGNDVKNMTVLWEGHDGYPVGGEVRIYIWNSTAWEYINSTHSGMPPVDETILKTFTDSSNYVDSNNKVYVLAGIWTGESMLYTDYVMLNVTYQSNNSLDIKNVSLANDEDFLFVRLATNGSIDLSDDTYYRLFISKGLNSGKNVTPENNILPFRYDYRIEVKNKTSCKVYLSPQRYNFAGITFPTSLHNASYGHDANKPPLGLILENEIEFGNVSLGTNNYSYISALDGVNADYGQIFWPNYSIHKFEFITHKNTEAMNSINISWTGHGCSFLACSNNGSLLYIWNGTEWKKIGEHYSGTDQTLNYTITSDFEKYIDINGSLFLLAESNGTAGMTPPSRIITDYVEVLIDYNYSYSLANCSSENTASEIEIAVNLTDIDSAIGDIINTTFETANSNARFDLMPDYSSFLEYEINESSNVSIKDVSASPQTQGYGENVTIIANVSGPVDKVFVGVISPSGIESNYTMNNATGIYLYNYSNWTSGTYNYRIYANDTGGILTKSSSYTFDIYSNLSIKVKTIKNVYGPNLHVDLTDNKLADENNTEVYNNYITNTSFYLLMKVQYYNSSSWIDDDVVVNNTQKIRLTTNSSVRLDIYFNGKWNTSANASFGSGLYRVWASAVDLYGTALKNIDGSNITAVYNFSIDMQKPQIVLNYPYDNYTTKNATVNLNWTAFDNIDVNLTCNLTVGNTVEAENFNSPNGTEVNYSSMFSNGIYYWNVTCWDDAGNINISETRKFIIDPISPNLQIQMPENKTYNYNTSLPLNYTVSDNNQVDKCWYNLDSGQNTTLNNCNNVTFNTSEGWHRLYLYVNDTAGNLNNKNISFSVDTIPPQLSIQLPQNQTYNYVPILNYTVNYADKCWYSNATTDNISLTSCNNLSAIGSEGWNSVRVYANDTAGNIGNSSLVAYTIDTISPAKPQIQSPTNKTYNTQNINLNYTVSEVSQCKYELDGSNTTLANCQNITMNSLSQSQHSVKVWINDSANNWNVSDTVYFTVDITNPQLSIQQPQNRTYNYNTSLPLNYTVSDANLDKCWYNLDNGNNVTLNNCQNVIFNASEGWHILYLFANDTAGNLNNTASVRFTIDMTPPSINIQSPTNKTYNYIPTLNYTVSDPDKCWYILNGNTNNLSGCSNLSSIGTEGWNSLSVFVNDTAGNTNSISVNFTIDTNVPMITIQRPENKTYNYNTSLPLNYTVSSGIDKCWYNIDIGINRTLANCQNATINASEGSHILYLYANSTAGNSNYATMGFTIDTSKPLITFVSPTPYNETKNETNQVYINVTVFPAPNWIRLEWNGTNITMSGSGNVWYRIFNGLALGNYTFKVYANNSAGTMNVSEKRWVYISYTDNVPPELIVYSPASIEYSTVIIPLNYVATDNVAIDKCWYKLNSGFNITLDNCNNITFNAIKGTNVVIVSVNDTSGNMNSTTIIFIFSIPPVPPSPGPGPPPKLIPPDRIVNAELIVVPDEIILQMERNETETRNITVENVGDIDYNINITIVNISDMVILENKDFKLPIGRKNTVYPIFSAIREEGNYPGYFNIRASWFNSTDNFYLEKNVYVNISIKEKATVYENRTPMINEPTRIEGERYPADWFWIIILIIIIFIILIVIYWRRRKKRMYLEFRESIFKRIARKISLRREPGLEMRESLFKRISKKFRREHKEPLFREEVKERREPLFRKEEIKPIFKPERTEEPLFRKETIFREEIKEHREPLFEPKPVEPTPIFEKPILPAPKPKAERTEEDIIRRIETRVSMKRLENELSELSSKFIRNEIDSFEYSRKRQELEEKLRQLRSKLFGS